MASGWLIALGLINVYIILLVWLVRSGRMERYNLSLLLGFILMIRTQRGRSALAVIARPKRFWNAFGDLGVAVSLIGMFGMTALFLAILPTVLRPNSNIVPVAANEILVIPGINPIIPLWYGIMALIVTLVVHEGGHGILALSNKMRIKSLGLLFAIFPIGAFVEPDEQDLTESPRRSRLRVYAAGPAVNFAVAGIVLVGLAAMAGAVTPLEGAHVWTVVADAPSDLAGILPRDILVAADGQPIVDWNSFSAIMATHAPGDAVNFTAADGGTHNATLISQWDSFALDPDSPWQDAVLQETPAGIATCEQRLGAGNFNDGADCAEQLDQLAFLGISPFPTEGAQGILAEPLSSGRTFLQLSFLPLQEVRGNPLLSAMPDFFETPWGGDGYWILVNAFFWIFWMNLMVGLTNILPMLPLDGGHLFRDSMAGIMEKLRPKATAEQRDRVVGRIAGGMSLLILVAFLLQIFGPRLVQAFA